MTLLGALDHLSVAVFALTGAMVASRSQLDIVGFIFIGCLTALGGGTARDLLLDRPPLWLADASFLANAACAAVVVFFAAHLVERRFRSLLEWLDAFALSVAVAAGAGVALDLGHGGPVVVVMGIVTGCLGGLARDVVCNELPFVLKQGEPYVSCAFGGALLAVLVAHLGFGRDAALLAGAAATFGLRAGAIGLGWRLPVYRAPLGPSQAEAADPGGDAGAEPGKSSGES